MKAFHSFVTGPDNVSSWIRISRLMALVCPIGPINWEEFEREFRLAMGREMTPQERTWLRLSNLALAGDDDDEENAGANLNAA